MRTPPWPALFPYTTLFRSARVRNVVLEGDWPEQLSEQQLAKLTAPRDAKRALAARTALGEIFAERHVPDSALYVHRRAARSEEHTSELQSRRDLVCRLLLE